MRSTAIAGRRQNIRRRRGLGTVPLERALSKLGLATRTQARQLITAGKVEINGKIVRNPLMMIVPERAQIRISGKIQTQPKLMTIMLHKPPGVVTTRSDEKGRATVFSCLSDLDAHLNPVGRLDLATTGLLLFTNDTRFAAWITEPTNNIPRRYVVTVGGEVDHITSRQFERGITEGGELLRAQQVMIQKRSKKETHLIVELTEGKNREIRRMMSAAGFEVTRLKRIAFGGLELGNLACGKWRNVSIDELKKAFPNCPIRELR